MATALRGDILLHQPNGALAAIIEVKNSQDLDVDSAAIYRRNLIAHGIVPQAPYFLLLSQEKAYVWQNRTPQELNLKPDFNIDMAEVLRPYMPSGIKGRLRGEELEMVVYSWLADLVISGRNPVGNGELALDRAGFIPSIRGATLSLEAA